MSKRKLEDLIDSFESMNFYGESQKQIVAIAQPPPAKRGHTLPISISKLKLEPCAELIRFNKLHRFKNIFGLEQLPEQDTFSREEVEILIDQRERQLYRKYLALMEYENIPDKIVHEVHELS